MKTSAGKPASPRICRVETVHAFESRVLVTGPRGRAALPRAGERVAVRNPGAAPFAARVTAARETSRGRATVSLSLEGRIVSAGAVLSRPRKGERLASPPAPPARARANAGLPAFKLMGIDARAAARLAAQLDAAHPGATLTEPMVRVVARSVTRVTDRGSLTTPPAPGYAPRT